MLKVEDYREIRVAHRQGMSVREIARKYHHSRRKIREVLANPEPKPYKRVEPYPCPVLDEFKLTIDQILSDDEDQPRKQRHTAAQICRRLKKEHGYMGSYDQVRRYVKKKKKKNRETFIPLNPLPGQRLEADFGHVYVDFPYGRVQVPVLLTTWSFSDYPFAIGMPTERLEAVLKGMTEAFDFYECIPVEVWWDNPRTVVGTVLKGREREINERYQALASHYAFEPMFCMPASGNEKPYVENKVYSLQRRFCTPVPKCKDLDDFNEFLRRCCLAERERTEAGKEGTIGERFEIDRAHAEPLPEHRFDPCVEEPAKVDKYQTARFDNNRYSVPVEYAFEKVTVKAYVDELKIVFGEKVIARHRRSYQKNDPQLDPLHYLPTLAKRPNAIDHSDIFRNWDLPACFDQLRRTLEKNKGKTAGLRDYIKVVGLVTIYGIGNVAQTIEHCLQQKMADAEVIKERINRVSQIRFDSLDLSGERDEVASLIVPQPELERYDQLLR